MTNDEGIAGVESLTAKKLLWLRGGDGGIGFGERIPLSCMAAGHT